MAESFRLYKYNVKDDKELHALLRQVGVYEINADSAWLHYYDTMQLRSIPILYIVRNEKNEIIASAGAKILAVSTCQFCLLCVRKDYRGKGIAHKLYNTLLKEVPSTVKTLQVISDIKFDERFVWEHWGYKLTGKHPDGFGNDELIYTKRMHDDYIFVPYSEEYHDQLIDLIEEVGVHDCNHGPEWSQYYRNIDYSQIDRLILCFKGTTVVASGGVKRLNNGIFELCTYYTRKEHSGKGLAKYIYEDCIQYVKRLGGHEVYAITHEEFSGLKMWEHLGFSIYKHEDDEYGNDQIFIRKEI